MKALIKLKVFKGYRIDLIVLWVFHMNSQQSLSNNQQAPGMNTVAQAMTSRDLRKSALVNQR